jgi:hypothetical protein
MLDMIRTIFVIFICCLGTALTFFLLDGIGIAQLVAFVAAPIGGIAFMYAIMGILKRL